MQAERWERIENLYYAAQAQPVEKRAAFLAQACAGDAALRGEVESLLDQQTDTFLEDTPPAGVQSLSAGAATGGAEDTGALIGRYRLLQKIGEGGMGEVWLAEQKEPVRRRVALKLVKAGMNTREVIARFESERQALALMDHPAIARVLDAGSTPQGAPYFVMEYVAGAPITVYCDQHRLTTSERLELFLHVCEGVQHAHQKAIIHRDLKPSNILVIELDGRAAPKIIDFGVAKALTQKLTADTLFTRVGSLIGTPEYMSPEQADSSGEDIDTRTDVYSLGIVFYELLVGTPPLQLRKVAFDEFLRRLREEEPPKPSARIRTQPLAASTDLARKRQSEPQVLARQMRGDLDAIALKAIEKDRSRRYGSPSDFGADIGRYLRNEAVLAVPPSVAYRARKFARRYLAALAIAGAFALVLITAAAISIRQSIRANREAAAAQAVNDFLQNDLLAQASAASQSGRKAKPDPDLKVRTALDRAAARVGAKFGKQPEVEAAIRDTIGRTYMDLGLYPEARTQFERALELNRRMHGTTDPTTLRSVTSLGRIAFVQGRYPQAEALGKQALEIQRRLLGPEHPDTLSSMNALANVYYDQGKSDQAEALYSQTLEIRRHVLGPEHPDTLRSIDNLCLVYIDRGKYPQAETLERQILELRRRVLGPEHPDTLSSMDNLAIVYDGEGKPAQAEELFSQTLDAERRVLGPRHPLTLQTMDSLAIVYSEQGKYAEAAALQRAALEISRAVLGPEHTDTLSSMDNLAIVYEEQGKYAQSEALQTHVLEISRRVLGTEHVNTLRSMNNLAIVYAAQGKYPQAETLFHQTLEISRRVLGPENPSTLSFLAGLAAMEQIQGRYALAQIHAAEVLAGRRHALGPENSQTMESAADLALAHLSEGNFAASEPLARESLDFNQKNRPGDWQRFRAESLLGAALSGQQKFTEAEPLLLEGYQGMLERKDRIAIPDLYHLDRAREWLGQLYRAWGKPGKAAAWSTK